ncbi:hypothetical protein PENSUB_185 [Penicillium subrubescens]|uniref:RRM domain-containing protein n=1 Tax=Penicillium subrubescens TaxID=1316194 RepID=A0A1Q5UNN1_9EURO|nr:hypothetical protein PENSUB_185 [Penicillium subrubescens]
MADRPKDVPGEQTGSSDEVSQILGLYAGQEAPEDEIETVDSSYLEISSLPTHYLQDVADIYQMQMATYHQRQLDEVLAPGECPIGSDAETCFRGHHAVVLIENIPYNITRQEVIQFFGNRARLASGWPVHIIMDRSSGKTNECYVEFATHADAEDTIRRIKALHDSNQGPRMGNRYVDVSISSQAALMKALFPHAKCISWETGRPVVVPDESWPNGFAGFLTDEELFCTARHVREPGRSAHTHKIPQRPYESINSTMWKFPWFATHLYTVHTRNKIHFTLKTMMEHLVQRLRGGGQIVGLDTRLVTELLRAGIECPAFNPRMKYVLAEISDDQAFFGRMSDNWLPYFPFDTLTWLRPNNPNALEFYGMLILNGRVVRIPRGLERRFFGQKHPHPYGDWWFAWDEPVASEKIFSDAINDEKQVLQTLLTTGHGVMTPVRQGLSLAPYNFPRSGYSTMGAPEQQGPAHWPSQGPNPYVVAAPMPAATPAPAPTPLPAPVARRSPGPLGPPAPRGPQSPRGRGNWRGPWRGASSRGHRRF